MEQDHQRYADLNKHFEEEDRFPYHLKQLTSKGFVSKSDDLYSLTFAGGRQFEYFDAKTLTDVENKLPVLVLIVKYGNKYLLKNNYGNDYGLWPIRLHKGVEIEESVEAKMKKYSLNGSYTPIGFRNLMRHSQTGELVYDTIFIAYEVDLEEESSPGERFKYFELEEIKQFVKRDMHELTWEFILN